MVKIKRFILTFVIVIVFFEILLSPQSAMLYAKEGLLLWFQTMIPALFPFMVLTSVIVNLDLIPNVVSIVHPILYFLFRTNYYCEYAIVMGFLCGYPMGAVIVKNLYQSRKISQKEADFLLAFCNNIGPVFFSSIVLPQFGQKYAIPFLAGMYVIPFLYGILLRYFCYQDTFFSKDEQKHSDSSKKILVSAAVTEAMNQSVSTILFLGACMICFNMLRFIPDKLAQDNFMLQIIFAWCLEVNGAILKTGSLFHDGYQMQAISMVPLLQIGGLSCLFQTLGILSATNLRFLPYLIHKTIQALLWLFLIWMAFFVFLR